MNPLLSFFFTNLLNPHKTLSLPPSQSHSRKQSWFFFWVKNSSRALHCHRTVDAPFFFFFSFFLFLSKKVSQKHSLPKRDFHLKLSRTLMRVQRLTECYGWSFNNGDLVLWVCNVFIFFNKNSSDLNRQNRSRFTKLSCQTMVRMGPYFFCMERFLMLNRP